MLANARHLLQHRSIPKIRQWQEDPEAGAERSGQGREERQSHGEGEIVNEDIDCYYPCV